MPMKQAQRKQYRTMQGKQIDLDMLRKKNELTPAVGNMKVNARGDEIGAGGKIVRKREDLMRDYYTSMPHAVPDESAPRRPVADTVVPEPETKPKTTRSRKKESVVEAVDGPTAAELAEWEEDDDGNFVQKKD